MSDARTCQHCGAVLPGRAPEGLCPRCLMGMGRGLSPDAMPGSPSRPSPAPPSTAQHAPFSVSLPLGFGDYELLEELGRGGMGVVYKARQRSLGRIVAVKMILAGPFAGPLAVQRFLNEARAVAGLQHAHIVAVHDAGQHEGQHFFCMDYVEGASLDELVRDHPWPAARAAQCVQTLAQAIHYAHERGVLHRDLKPSNVLIDTAGHPRITDFGLAKRLNESTAEIPESKTDQTRSASGVGPSMFGLLQSLTLTGQVLGSPHFMPPELARGRHTEAGPPSDIYSLGAILYHLLTARPPFLAETMADTLQQVMHTEPAPPRLLNPRAPRDLDTICLKCLAKAPSQRYATAQELAEDLGRYLRHEPILARPVGAAVRFWRLCRRRPALAASLLLSAVLLLLILIGSPIAAYRIDRERQRAQQNANEKDRERQRAQQNLVRQYVANGNRLVDEGDLFGALPWFAEALKLEQDNPARAQIHRLRLDSTIRQCPKLVQCWFHQDGLEYAQWSPDGTRVVTACADKTARVWDANTGELITDAIRHTSPILHAEFSPDGRWIVTASRGGSACVWDATTGSPRTPKMGHRGAVVHATFSLDGRRVVTASEDRTARVWDASNGQPIGPPLRHIQEVLHAEFSRDGLLVVTSGKEGKALVHDAASGVQVGQEIELGKVSYLSDASTKRAAFHPNSRFVLTLFENQARVTDREQNLWKSFAQDAPLTHAEFSLDGRLLVTAGRDCAARVWNVSQPSAPITPPLRHQRVVMDASFSQDSRLVATASDDNSGRVWDATTGEPFSPPLKHLDYVRSATFSKDGHRVMTLAHYDRFAKVWDLTGSEEVGPPVRSVSLMLDAAFTPDGRCAVTIDLGGRLAVWDLSNGSQVGPLRTNVGTVRHAAVSPDGRLLATASQEGTAQLWDLKSGQPASPPLEHAGPVNGVRFSPDGRRVVTASSDASARVWDVPSGRMICRVALTGAVSHASFTIDGSEVVAATFNTRRFLYVGNSAFWVGQRDAVADSVWVGRWNADTGESVSPPVQLPVPESLIAVSPDGRGIFTAALVPRIGAGSRVWVWDVATGKPRTPPFEAVQRIRHAAFSPDGRRVVTASLDRTARVWDAATGRPVTPPMEHRDAVVHASFSPAGNLVVTASQDQTARVWDAATGEPVTPPLKHNATVNRALFSPDSRRLLTMTDAPRAYVWELPDAVRPLADDMRRAQVLSGQRLDETGGLVTLTPEALFALWQEVRSQFPRDFQTSPAQVLAWRQRVAEDRAKWQSVQHRQRGDRAIASTNWAEAAAEFSKAIALNPDDSFAYSGRQWAFAELRDYERLEADAKRILELLPTSAGTHHELAYVYFYGPRSIRSFRKALPFARTAVELEPDKHSYASTLAHLYYRLGQFEDAIKTLQNKAPIEAAVLQAGDWLVLAMSHHHLGNIPKAAEYSEKARKWWETGEGAVLPAASRQAFEDLLAEAQKLIGKAETR